MLLLCLVMLSAPAQLDASVARPSTAAQQQPAPECISVRGARVCGYHCLNSGSMGLCAQTPDGVCATGEAGQVTCFDPPLFLKRVYGAALPRPRCVSHALNMACGYNCATESDGLACAKTPAGVCVAGWASATCFDPPVEVYGVYGTKVPEPACLKRNGQMVCGYNCTVGGASSMGCNRTPFGVCAEKGGPVSCFDPDRYVVCAKGTATPKPECVYQSGGFTCGYHCANSLSQVTCAKTPDGSCNAEGVGAPVCFDPPVRGGDEQCVELIGLR